MKTRSTPTYLTALGIIDAHDGTQTQREYLQALARKHRGHREAMAEDAGVSVATIYRVLAAQALHGAGAELEAPRCATVQDLASVTGLASFRLGVSPRGSVSLTAGGRVFHGPTYDAALDDALRWARAEKAARDAGGRLV